ncbi:PilZ domain-containing protein [Roseomonas sp. CAU 1739]|uniref:PilZ domain-containing protein n=1 Tax=Roseomonas sp. CAU 1739 TaxID=3140364 RepID=UPI00325A48AD
MPTPGSPGAGGAMSDTVPGAADPSDDRRKPLAGAAPNGSAAVILAGLGERRSMPRTEVQLPCTVHVGSHVQDATVRDVSPGGAMLNGVRGLLAHDLIRIHLGGREDLRFVAEVRGVSLLGVHVAILSADDQPRWRDAIRDLVTSRPAGSD